MVEQILKNVRTIRELAEFSQETMAERLSMTQSQYARFETGKIKTDLTLLERFADDRNLSVVDIITYPQKYVPERKKEDDLIETIIQIKIAGENKTKILKEILGDSYYEIIENPKNKF